MPESPNPLMPQTSPILERPQTLQPLSTPRRKLQKFSSDVSTKKSYPSSPKYSLAHFIPFPDSYQLHVVHSDRVGLLVGDRESHVSKFVRLKFTEKGALVVVLNVFGELAFIHHDAGPYSLEKMVPEYGFLHGEDTLELSCSDLEWIDEGDCKGLLATFWVRLDRRCYPQKFFGSLFKITPDLRCSLVSTIDVNGPVAHCKIAYGSAIRTAERRKLLAFPVNSPALVYVIKENSYTLACLNEPQSVQFSSPRTVVGLDAPPTLTEIVFPELALSPFRGLILRSSCHYTTTDSRWSVVGLDTGLIVVAISSSDNALIARQPLKFAGPISVLRFLPFHSTSETQDDYILRLLISSTFGPAQIYKYRVEDDKLLWEVEFILEDSHLYEGILCCATLPDFIVLGTHHGTVLFYELPGTPPSPCSRSHEFSLDSEDSEPQAPTLHSISSINVGASINAIEQTTDNELCVLTTKGVHFIQRSGT